MTKSLECKEARMIKRTETLNLSKTSAEALYRALENPPNANDKLLKAAQRYKRMLKGSSQLYYK